MPKLHPLRALGNSSAEVEEEGISQESGSDGMATQ